MVWRYVRSPSQRRYPSPSDKYRTYHDHILYLRHSKPSSSLSSQILIYFLIKNDGLYRSWSRLHHFWSNIDQNVARHRNPQKLRQTSLGGHRREPLSPSTRPCGGQSVYKSSSTSGSRWSRMSLHFLMKQVIQYSNIDQNCYIVFYISDFPVEVKRFVDKIPNFFCTIVIQIRIFISLSQFINILEYKTSIKLCTMHLHRCRLTHF